MGDTGIKAVLFDLDGTLLDTHDLLLASFRHATRTVLGVELPDEVLMARVGTPLAAQMADFTPDPALQERLLDVYRTFNHAVHDERVKPFEGVVPMVEELARRGLRMGVVTSKRRWLAERGLALFGLDRHMDFVIGPDECPRHKPDPLPVTYGCRELGLDPAACLYVGDSPFDMAAGNGAGCIAVAVTWGMFSREVLLEQGPAHVIDAPAELLALV